MARAMAARSGSLPSESTPTYTSTFSFFSSVFLIKPQTFDAASCLVGNTYDGSPYVLSNSTRSKGARVKQRGSAAFFKAPPEPLCFFSFGRRGWFVKVSYPKGVDALPHQSSRRQSPVWNTRPHFPSNRNATLPGQ
jgi:hypothetical protein